MAGQKIGVLGGTTTQEALSEILRQGALTAEVVVVETHDEGFAKLQQGAVSAYFGDRTILEDRLRRLPADGQLLLADNYLTIEPYALAMPIDHSFRLATAQPAVPHRGHDQGVPEIVRPGRQAIGPG